MSMSDYGKTLYWDERYSSYDGQLFDWYTCWESLKPHILPFLSITPDFEILIPGCGSSTLGCDLFDSGYLNITNVDNSSVCINQMIDRYADRQEMEYTLMDCTDLDQYPDGCFNLIVDKGLFDSVICSPLNVTNVKLLLNEMYRVLKHGGVYLCISHSPPTSRIGYLSNKSFNWAVEVRQILKTGVSGDGEVKGGDYHYMYICRKANSKSSSGSGGEGQGQR